MRIWDIITGRRHHYFVKIHYYSKDGKQIFAIRKNVHVWDQGEICNYRGIKKALHRYIYNPTTKPYLCSGYIMIEQISYLGKFSSEIVYDDNLRKLEAILLAYMAVFHNKRK